MKHLFLSLLFSASLTAFSQENMTELRRLEGWGKPATHVLHQNPDGSFSIRDPDAKPDTLRVIILATMCRRCAAEPMPGYVVIAPGKRPVYLDCRKRALKWPQMGWDFREVDPNVNQE